jgi:4-amino-4-deoxy-L-arabinose transferase-like glycosyltransferase
MSKRTQVLERKRTGQRPRADVRARTDARELSSSVGLRELLRRVPRAAWLCALVACLNAACWSLLTPAFQAPDEPDHFAYVKQFAETSRLPSSTSEGTSSEESAVLSALNYAEVRLRPQNHTIATAAEQGSLARVLASTPHSRGSEAAGVAVSQPPLYYALEAIPYSLAQSGTVLARLQLMRLMSALFAGLTALFAFLFIREALPGAPWAWTVGGLAVALAPLLGFISGAVNPDAMLFAVSAAIFYLLARAFRRGLSTRGAAAIGVVTAIGLLTKLNFAGLVPGILLGLVVVSVRAARISGRSAYRMLALALAIAFSPAVLYAAVNIFSNHRALGPASGFGIRGSALAEIDYIWQLYLPHLPGTTNDFPGLFTARQLWFNGYVGLYGWLDTSFPRWVYTLALIPAGAIALLCARALFEGRAALRGRAVELVVYAVIAIGVMTLVGAASYFEFPRRDAGFAEARYMLPMLALLGAVVALAARGAGRRWGPAVGALIVVLFLAHDIFSQLLVVGRYYG